MRLLRRALGAVADVMTSPFGFRTFRRTRQTPHGAYRVMRKSMTVAPRLAPRLYDSLLASRTPCGPRGGDGILGPVADGQLDTWVEQLRYDGFVGLGTAPRSLCDHLEVLARQTPAVLLPVPDEVPMARFDRGHVRAPKYDIPEATLLADSAVQELLVDPMLLDLAGRYLRHEPVNSLAAMWWSAPVPDGPSSEIAQLFHADRDHPRFLKIFCYLTDVGPTTGPHVYVRGSHRDRPVALRADRRFSDAEVLAHVDPADVLQICGPRGLLFAADTSGLHKGLPPSDGARLIFQLEFASSLFGAPYTGFPVEELAPAVARTVAMRPHAFQRFAASSPPGE